MQFETVEIFFKSITCRSLHQSIYSICISVQFICTILCNCSTLWLFGMNIFIVECLCAFSFTKPACTLQVWGQGRCIIARHPGATFAKATANNIHHISLSPSGSSVFFFNKWWRQKTSSDSDKGCSFTSHLYWQDLFQLNIKIVKVVWDQHKKNGAFLLILPEAQYCDSREIVRGA